MNALLAEMDGFESRKSVYIIAATNRPDIIDPAMMRGGRLDKPLYVPLPDKQEKINILKALLRKTPLEDDINFEYLLESNQDMSYSGADLCTLVKEAGLMAILKGKQKISMQEFMDSKMKT